MPWLAANSTCTVSVPASGSASERPFPAPAENATGVLNAVVCGPGTVNAGASLTLVTAMVNAFSKDAPLLSLVRTRRLYQACVS